MTAYLKDDEGVTFELPEVPVVLLSSATRVRRSILRFVILFVMAVGSVLTPCCILYWFRAC